MNMDAIRQYLKVLQERYFMAKSREDNDGVRLDIVAWSGFLFSCLG